MPVENSLVAIYMKEDGRIYSLNINYLFQPELNVVPSLSAKEASLVVSKDLGIKEIVDLKRSYKDGQLVKETLPVKPELVIYAKDGKPHLCWKFRFYLEKPVGLWVYYIDAHTGGIDS